MDATSKTCISGRSANVVPSYHVMTKPIGSICNLDCTYCYYLEKENLYPPTENFRMTDETLEAFVRQYIEQQDAPEISFAWQGGEPTLLGVGFFQKVVALQARYANGKTVTNALQTNGVLLDDEWGRFLAEHKFLVGLSIDGPRALHDRYRVDKGRKPTFDLVMRGLDVLKKHKVEFNTLTVVNRANAPHPLEVYRFLREVGSGFIQFIPIVERKPHASSKSQGLDFHEPPPAGEFDDTSPVTPWSLDPRQYGEFLVAIFDEWVRRDVGTVFVQLFDVALGQWAGRGAALCVFAERCGNALALEHNGDLYSCDHYVYPHYKLGNILNQSLGDMVRSDAQRKFGNDKLDSLPRYCRECDVRFACNGECPKHRFKRTPDGEPGLNYLCPAYKRFFRHVDPYMRVMADLIQAGQPAALVMDYIAQRDAQTSSQPAKPDRNAPCPCGSGRKHKLCCGRR